jgi:hydroxypyruvate isomerase
MGGCRVKDSVSSPAKISADLLSGSERRRLLSGFAVNLESWWTDDPFEVRIEKAAKAGFSHAEFWFVSGSDRDPRKLATLFEETGLSVSQIVGDAPALAQAENRSAFLSNMERAIEDAQILNTDIVTVTGHQNIEGITTKAALKHYQDHLAASAPLWEAAQIYAAIEPFNPYDHPGHFINGAKEAVKICQSINSPFVKINWDLFHMQRAEGNVIDNMREGAEQICYMQMADSPARHEPGTGEMDYANIIRTARALGYERPIGLELWANNGDYDKALGAVLNLAQNIERNEAGSLAK